MRITGQVPLLPGVILAGLVAGAPMTSRAVAGLAGALREQGQFAPAEAVMPRNHAYAPQLIATQVSSLHRL